MEFQGANVNQIINNIKSDENKRRKAESFKQFEIFNDRISPYVKEYLKGFFQNNTVREMMHIGSMNICKRIVMGESSIYKNKPKRTFVNATPAQVEALENIYDDMNFNKLMQTANRFYKLQSQATVYIRPKKGKLIGTNLKMHQFDVIPDMDNPEKAEAYILSVFDRQLYTPSPDNETATGFGNRFKMQAPDGITMTIADNDDYKKQLKKERYVFWSEDQNFIMNGLGEIVSDDTETALPEHLPFIDIAHGKDSEFFVRSGSTLCDFTVEYNAYLSTYHQIVAMQGFAQAWLKGPENLMPEYLVIGPNHILRLKTDPQLQSQVDFGFSNPGSDLAGVKEFGDNLLNIFLTTRGVDPSMINSQGNAIKYSSALERYLAMIEKFEISKDDYESFQLAEEQCFELIKQWHNAAIETSDLLDEKYLSSKIGDDVYLEIEFKKPEFTRSKSELIDEITKAKDSDLMSDIDGIMEFYGIGREAAIEKLAQIKEDNLKSRETLTEDSMV